LLKIKEKKNHRIFSSVISSKPQPHPKKEIVLNSFFTFIYFYK